MNVVHARSPGQPAPGPASPKQDGWQVPALAGAAGFWLANLAISATSVAADYRAAVSVPYAPMLVEAAAGGLVLGSAVAFLLVRFPAKIPGAGPLSKALLLAAVALLLVTLAIELPTKLSTDVHDRVHWLVVATVFNAIRILALALTVAWVTGARAKTKPTDTRAAGGHRDG